MENVMKNGDFSELLSINPDMVHRNLSSDLLMEISLNRGEGKLAANGALVTRTGERTGRSPKDRYVVEDSWSRGRVCWGDINQPISEEVFDGLLDEAVDYLKNKDRYVFEGFVGADSKYRMPIRIIAEKVWHALFATTLFVRPKQCELDNFTSDFTVIDALDLRIDPSRYGIRTGTFVAISFERKIVLIIASGYGGEIKKSIFSVMNGLLPEKNVFPMHCSANIGAAGDSALFFGLSGTGKTTLSADPKRRLIGDDEHGWSDAGIFNFEGGCYAKAIALSEDAEPQIFNAIRKGSILENVVMDDKSCEIDYCDASITENTRATYPVEHIPNCVIPGMGDHPRNIFFLACDAFGVLPPIAKLTPEMATYHFLSGYTAKLAGTEVGVDEPEATFSTCFGAPFMPLNPTVYAKLLGERIAKHRVNCWLVNSGWSKGPYGEGRRMKIRITRALLDAALNGQLDDVEYVHDSIFNILVPKSCSNVPSEILFPRNTWRDQEAYDRKARDLALLFRDNFKQFEEYAEGDVIAAGPYI
ncbi:MAG: phosphoenolpyruvate carboxykinase (ATP) [Deltaproteobacteria bacterium]|jgi:phosphoenolpyruvate carboxykinase (ATP)|nr:phosphoenolpyruvate carboxykinase (ATP) [Deltaproteobacteria bacterium]